MSVPHPKGPRSFRNFCQSAHQPARRVPTPPVLVSSVDTTWLKPIDAPEIAQGIDLTSFASRVAPPTGARFDLPAGFFSRLNALKIATTTPGHSLDLGTFPVSAMAEKT